MCSCALWGSTTTVQKLPLRCSSLERAWHPSTEVSARRARRGRRGCLCSLHAQAQRAWACHRVWVCVSAPWSCRSADAKSGSLPMSARWVWETMREAQTCHGLAVDPPGCGQQLLAVDHWAG